MSPATNGPGTMWRGLTSLWMVAVLTAGSALGEDRGASPAASSEPAPPSKTNGTDEKKPADAVPTATSAGALASGRAESATRVALAEKGAITRVSRKRASTGTPETPIQRAVRTVEECQERYQSINDYTCTFFKRERISGRLIPVHIMDMKVRTKPQSIYLRFQQPAKGREAIYVAGRHGGKVVAHDVGFNKLLAGTLQLEPTGARAMEDCRHPITEAGIGPLLETVSKRWALELNQNESVVTFQDMLVGEQHCLMIETTHPEKSAAFLFYRVRLYINKEIGLPTRFEAYNWPKHQGAEPELDEEYTYGDLKLNVGLTELDFDVANRAYSFGRF